MKKSVSLKILSVAGAILLSISVASGASDAKGLEGRLIVAASIRPTDLILYIANPPAALKPSRATTAVIDQRNHAYIPRVLPIVKGTAVKFQNSDRVAHNVFSMSPTKSFDLGKIAPKQFGSVTFEKSGIVELLCGFHSQMIAYIRVLDHPYFTVPDQQGKFIIQGVPAGTYELRIWHETVGEVAREIKAVEGPSLPIQISFPK